MITARTLAKSGRVLLPPVDALPLGGGVVDFDEEAVELLFAALLASGADGEVPVEELEVLEPLISRRFGGGGGAALAPKLEELGESSRVVGAAAATALCTGAGFVGEVVFDGPAVLGAVEAVGAAFGLGATTFAAGFTALDFRGAGFFGPEVLPGPTFVAPVPSSLSASLTTTPVNTVRYAVEYTKLNCVYCTA